MAMVEASAGRQPPEGLFDAVTCAIPDGKNVEPVVENCRASELPPLGPREMTEVERIYRQQIRPLAHQRW